RASLAMSGVEPPFVLRGGPRVPDAVVATTTPSRLWADLRDRWGGGLYFEWIKHDLAERIDLLLMDCDPHGVGQDTVAMLATSAADILVLLSDYSNDQTAAAYHFLADLTGVDRGVDLPRRPSILPVPAGIERTEMELHARGQEGFAFNFAKFL